MGSRIKSFLKSANAGCTNIRLTEEIDCQKEKIGNIRKSETSKAGEKDRSIKTV